MTQAREAVTAQVLSIVRSEIELSGELTPDMDFIAELHIDSLDALRVALMVETEFGVEFDQSTLAAFRTVADIVRAVESQTGPGNAVPQLGQEAHASH